MGKFLVIPTLLLTWATTAFGQSTSVTVDGKANVYAAGRGVAFNGVLPPAVRFAAGAGRVLTFPTVSGTIACNGIAYEPLHGPDGTVNRCGGTGTNIASWAGISGIVHRTREMFLVGVFLDEREPSDPAPDRLDFSTTENYANLSPLIGQVFFIGDGRTSGGAVQQVAAPAAATRLYLGFADAVGFSGAPYGYNDNNGSLQVTVAGVTPFVPGPVATGTTMTVNGKSSIYWSGLDVNWPTEMPPGWKFTAAPGRVMTVRASGSVTCKDGISAPPEGTAACGPKTDIEPYGSISGIKHPTRSMFLVGVFLNDWKPGGWPPTALDFTNDGYTTLEPLIGQTFYIGTGAGKRIVVPHDATRVFLGYARSDLMTGNAGWYQQGGGSLTAAIDLSAGTATGVSPVQVDAKSNLYAAGRETAFDGYLPPMVRLNPGPGKILTVPQVTGRVRCCGGGYTTADGAGYYTNLNAYRGLSGIEAKWRGYFLAGVFLDDNVPDGAPPAKLVFTEPFEFRSLAPLVGQVFLIGDGVTTAGVPHEYAIPATATRLYLGFAMGRLFSGDPGYYWEASDSYTATLNIAGGTTPPACTYALSETARQMPAAAGTASVAVTAAAGCGWTAVSGAAWVTVTSGASGSGPGTVAYAVAANTGAARSGTLTIGGQTLTVSQAAGASACTYTINAATQSVTAAGGTLTVQVTAGTGCAWTAASNAAWLTVSAGASGTGNGSVTLTAAANTGAARSGTATIAGQTLTVSQAAVSATSAVEITDVVNDADGTAAFAPGGTIIIRGRNFAAATARVDSGVPWPNQLQGISVEVTDTGRTLTAPIGGIAAGWVTVQLPFGISTAVDLRVVTPAGRSAARTISVAPRSPRLYSADGSGVGPAWAYHADGYEVTANAPARRGEEILLIGTGFGAVSPAVPAGQLGIDPTGGGEPNRVSDTVEVEIQGITVRPRLAILDYFLVGAYAVIFTVPGQVTSQSPSLLVRVGGAASQRDVTLPVQAGTGCTYTVSPASAAVSAAGGSSSFTVATGAACAWTAASNQTWLTVTAGASGTGNGTVTLSAGANTGAARSATATIAGQTVTVSQAAASAVCAYAVDPTGFSVYHLVYQDTFQVVTAAACAWTAVSEAAWLRITGAASGTGPARVAFEVSANPAMTERTGVIRVGTAAFTIRQMGALATFEVDAKSNIFAAGRATAFNGLLPPGYRFSAGAGKVLALDVVNGATHCQSGTATIPADGAAFCVSGSTDVLSYRGIAGVVHGRKVMFLVGVFLDDREPADPAPARLDFTNNEDYTSLAPLLGQVFFLGNGRTAANAQQTVVVPETATRLFLGFADAEAFHGAPGAYQDNTGGLTVSLRVAPGTGGGSGGDGGGTSLTIDARSNIFASGRATAFDGLLPPSVRLAAGTGRSVTVTNATGTVRCASSAANGPDGGTECSANGTDLTSYQGIAGVIHTRKTMFLVGVFLTDAEPADPAPPRLDFSNNEGFATLSPLIGQTFFIGDGQTGTGAGTVQQFVAPDAATRLFLGFADGYSLHGSPGYYGDNSGSLGVTVSGGSGGGGAGCGYVVSPAVLTVAAAGGANSITVATAAACSWTAASNLAWARVTSTASASGPGTVSVTVDANSGAARTATLTIAGQSVTVNQAAGGGGTTCTYTIAPGSASFLAAGGTGRIDVTTQSGCAWTATSTAGWIAFTAGQSGTGSGAVSYTVAANLTASNRLGTISVGGKNHPVEQAGAAPASSVTIAAGGVVDTASFSQGLAPGSLFSIFGTDLAATTKQSDTRPWPTTLDGVTVEVTDGATTMKAPLIFVSPGQVNGQLPCDLKGASVQVRVRNSKGDSLPATVAIAPRAPRLFPWGDANAIVVHADFKLVSAESPAQPGEYLVAFLVGMGAVNPPVAAGVAATASPLSELTEKVTMKLGGVEAKVLFAGLAPEWIGLYQVNFQMPAGLLPGPAALEVLVGALPAQSSLNVACGAVWTKAVEQEVGPAGGTITTTAFSMSVPLGAVSATSKWTFSSGAAMEPQPGQLGSWWRWQGIPRETQAPIVFTLPKGTELAPGAAFIVVRPVHGKGELRVPLEKQDGVWTASIPPRQQPAASVPAANSLAAAKRNAAGNAVDWQFDEAYLAVCPGYMSTGDGGSGMLFYVHPKSMEKVHLAGSGKEVANGLVRAWDKMKQLGFGQFESRIWPRVGGSRLPIMVFVEPPHSAVFRYSQRYVEPTYWNGAFLLLIDPDVLMDIRDGFATEDTVAAETAAVLAIQLHYPVLEKFPAWSWWGKGMADTIEDLLSCRHTAYPKAEAIRALLTSGLEDDGKDAATNELLGVGARAFIEYLLLWEKLTLPGEVLAPQFTVLASTRPTEMLRISLASRGLGQRWLEFIQDWGRGNVHLDCSVNTPTSDPALNMTASPPLLEALVAEARRVEATTRGATVDVSLPNLSARHLLITLPKSTEVEDAMNLSLVFPPPQNADDQVKMRVAALDADGKVVSPWLTVDSTGRVPWTWSQGSRLWVWVVQSRFGKPGEMTNVQVVLKLTPKDQPPTGTPPWPGPGPTSLNFDSFVPMLVSGKLNYTGIQVWSSDYSATTFNWSYPNFTLNAPPSIYKESAPALTVSGAVDSARKVAQATIDARKQTADGVYTRVRVVLRDLPCTYREDGDYYYYTCEVTAAALSSNADTYVTNFAQETWTYKDPRWELQSTAYPDYKTLNPSAQGWNSAVLAVRFRGRL